MTFLDESLQHGFGFIDSKPIVANVQPKAFHRVNIGLISRPISAGLGFAARG
jgi:hypothetical protein